MSEYLVSDADLTAVADAIRAKTGSSEQLVFHNGFSEAVNNINNITTESYIESAKVVGVTTIRAYLFYSQGLLKYISIPSDTVIIGKYAFYACYKMINIDPLPDSIKYIHERAFHNSTVSALPKSLLSIGTGAFALCNNIINLLIPENVYKIDDFAFEMCKKLTSVTFEGKQILENSNGLLSASAFNSCTNLTTINVPWAEGAVSGAPWGATNATINYNYTGE